MVALYFALLYAVSQCTYKHILTFGLCEWKEISGFHGGQNSHCGLLDYDTMWAGSWVQHAEGTHSLHLQGRRWRLYASPKRGYRHIRLCVPSLQTNGACNISGLSAAVEFHVRSDTQPCSRQCYFEVEYYEGIEYNTCIRHSGTMFQCLFTPTMSILVSCSAKWHSGTLGNMYGGGTVVGECPLTSAGWLKLGRLEFGYIIEESATQHQQMLQVIFNKTKPVNYCYNHKFQY